MLRHLRISQFAILSDVELELEPGFNVLTGETGAGKSLIVDAVALLRGGRARADLPRAGADEGVVEAVFEPPAELAAEVAARLERAGLAAGDEVLVRRVVARGGRSRVYVNGGLTTAAALASVGELLVDLAGQHEHQGLVHPGRHAEILDAFGVEPALVAEMGRLHGRLRELGQALAAGEADARERAQREDFLRFQVDEIEAAGLAAGEERDLAEERERLRAAGRLGAAARRAEEALYADEGAVVDVVDGLLRELEGLVGIDRRLEEPLRQLREARALAEDAALALRRYAGGIEEDPARLQAVEDRLDLVGRLLRKHGASCAEILARRDKLAAELAELSDGEGRAARLRAELDEARAAAMRVAGALTAARRTAGDRLAKLAGEGLAELGLAGARVSVAVEPREEIGPRGRDRVELLLTANRGEEPRPLARIASGGELSRIMLALKLALRRADPVATYVFDEVDAGIGGAAAEVVGRQIRRVAEGRQVVCVTHLAQIAALADTHLRVEKVERDGRTETVVTRLSAKARREEIARMLGGIEITARTRAHADELIRRPAGRR